MRGFVTSWFYPPVTSAEGIVAYKLLKNSSFEYDVVSSLSTSWSYREESVLKSSNIHTYPLEETEFQSWIASSISQFDRLAQEHKYDFYMTRSMPPEGHQIGLALKKKVPSIPWIASFGDPIGLNPYEMQAYMQDPVPSSHLQRLIIHHPRAFFPMFKHMKRLYEYENAILEQADILVFPTQEQCSFTLRENYGRYIHKCLIIPHSFDRALYPGAVAQNDKYTFTYTGHLDSYRSPACIIRAVQLLKRLNPAIVDQISIRLIGNTPLSIRDMIQAFFLGDVISIEKPMDYAASLKVLQEADCLLHIDAFFGFLEKGSIFLASKLADYMGAGKPVLGITHKDSPAGKILTASGNEVRDHFDEIGVAESIVRLCSGASTPDLSVYAQYESARVAKCFDEALMRMLGVVEGDVAV